MIKSRLLLLSQGVCLDLLQLDIWIIEYVELNEGIEESECSLTWHCAMLVGS